MGKDKMARADAVPSISSARDALSDDIARRNTRYMWQMSTRIVCFIGAVMIDHWSRWVLVAGAVVLPYVAVVLANAGQERSEHSFSPFQAPELPPGPTTTTPLGPAPDAPRGPDQTSGGAA